MIANDPDAELDRRLKSFFTARAEMVAAQSPTVDDAIAALQARVRPRRAPAARFGGRVVTALWQAALPRRAWALILLVLLALVGLALGSILVGSRHRPSIVATIPHRNGVILIFGGVGTGYLAVDPTSRGVSPFHANGGTVTWSPDGTKLASAYDGAIWVQDELTGTSTRVTSCCTGVSALLNQSGHQPVAWSPDGSHLAFTDRGEIWTVGLDGAGLTQITHVGDAPNTGATAVQPAWSPDGSRIAFTLGYGGRGGSIASIGSDGTDLRTIVPASGAARTSAQEITPSSPVWSPDGSRIAYLEEVGIAVTMEVVTIRPDGSDRRVVFGAPTCCMTDWGDLAWAPDGTKIATITRGSDGGKESLLMMDSDGAGVVELLRSVAPGPVAWRPMP